MVLSMPSPFKHPATGVYWYRQRVPARLKSVAKGRAVTVTIDGYPSHPTIGDEIKVSLRTKLPADAKRFALEAQSEFDRIWLSFETGPVSLKLKQIVALSGEMYHVIRCALEDDPGEAGQWLSRSQERQADSVIASKSPRAALMIDPAGTLHSRLSSWVDGALAQRHLTVTQDTYQRLLVEFDRAAGNVAALLHKRASGDFSADTTAERFPSFEMAVSSPSVAPSYTGVTITKLLDGWSSRLKAPRPQTISRYRGIISQLVAYLGHDDAVRVDQVEERVNDIRHGGGWFTSGSPPANKSYVASEISRLGKFYVQNGMDTEDALDEAKTRFLASHTEVGGNFVYTGGKDIPKNFGTLASRAIEKYAEDFGGGEGVEASDLTIRPATEKGHDWLIVHQSGQYPVENKARANLTLRSLFEMERERQDKVKQKVIDEHTRKQKDLAAGITPLARMMPMVPGGVFPRQHRGEPMVSGGR